VFHNIPKTIKDRMKFLEEWDARDRIDGTPRLHRLRQVSRETGKFISILAAAAPEGEFIEIGTSAGYSTLWLTLASRETDRKITTFEILEEKISLARETFKLAGVEDKVNLIFGDALEHIGKYQEIACCFLDCEKEIYGDCYEAVIPNLVSGGILLADNAINHQVTLQPMLDRVLTDPRVDSLIVPIGKGVLVSRKI